VQLRRRSTRCCGWQPGCSGGGRRAGGRPAVERCSTGTARGAGRRGAPDGGTAGGAVAGLVRGADRPRHAGERHHRRPGRRRLTVAMKDFIVAFFGWFVLMGATASASATGGDRGVGRGGGGRRAPHRAAGDRELDRRRPPTGRRVSFVNSFAIEGHFFNFSTSASGCGTSCGWWCRREGPVQCGQCPAAVEGRPRPTQGGGARVAQDHSRYRVRTFSPCPASRSSPPAAASSWTSGSSPRLRPARHRRRINQAVVELITQARRAGPGAAAVGGAGPHTTRHGHAVE